MSSIFFVGDFWYRNEPPGDPPGRPGQPKHAYTALSRQRQRAWEVGVFQSSAQKPSQKVAGIFWWRCRCNAAVIPSVGCVPCRPSGGGRYPEPTHRRIGRALRGERPLWRRGADRCCDRHSPGRCPHDRFDDLPQASTLTTGKGRLTAIPLQPVATDTGAHMSDRPGLPTLQPRRYALQSRCRMNIYKCPTAQITQLRQCVALQEQIQGMHRKYTCNLREIP